MRQKPLLSIIVTFRNQRNAIEPTLSAFFEMESIPFELFVMEDGSTDGSSNAIQSLLDYYQHEHTYYFEHAVPAGRGNCLNEALHQCNGSIVWIPESIESIDESLLNEAVEALHSSEYAFFCDAETLPSSTHGWVEFLQDDNWPGDGGFLCNLSRVPSTQRFFNPYLNKFHALELVTRISSTSEGRIIAPWRTPSEADLTPDITPQERAELVWSILRTQDLSHNQLQNIFHLADEPGTAKQQETPHPSFDKLLAEAGRMKQDGRFSAAMELVEHVLAEQPGHQQAKRLKIEILERKRRFVEASELKHEMTASAKTKEQGASQKQIKTSVIIPTALYGKPALEHCLVSLAGHCNPDTTELVVIDNASLDDTHDYLKELQSKNFFHCKVITNRQNAGFAASINQGMDKASGRYACIMHNDVELSDDALVRLEQLMDANPEFAIIGPLTDKTLNPDQSAEIGEKHGDKLVKAEYLDSFCMMLRTDANLRLDETYRLAFFEDIDLCFQARKQGYKVGVATDVSVKHHFGTTTFALNLDTESEEYWRNVAHFNDKWNIELYSEDELKSKSRFDQLLALDSMVNPLFPEDNIRAWFEELFTDEMKTEILKTDHEPEILCQLVHLMMVMEQREVMRRLEDRLDDVELPASLTYQLIRFYFNRNIYSRCLHYLGRLKAEQQSLQSELYKLEILVNEKELEAAVPKLKELLEQAPSSPRLYKLAGDIHQFEGNGEEALSFYRIAHQINPFEYSPDGVEELRLKH